MTWTCSPSREGSGRRDLEPRTGPRVFYRWDAMKREEDFGGRCGGRNGGVGARAW